MASIQQIQANRLNARKSTGPRSVEGKAASSQNALKTGIDAKALVIRGEKAADLEALTSDYLDRFHPSTPEERCFVDTLIRDDWQLRRLARADAQIWEYDMRRTDLNKEAPLGDAFDSHSHTFARLQRRIDATERSYKLALRELQRLQAQRAALSPQLVETQASAPTIGFLPQLSPIALPEPAAPAPAALPEPSQHEPAAPTPELSSPHPLLYLG